MTLADIWKYYEGMDRRFEYAEKLAGSTRFFGADLRDLLVKSLVYGFDFYVKDDGSITAVRHLNAPSGPLERQVLVGGRGFGKTARLKEWTTAQQRRERARREAPPIPSIASVRWTCKPPTSTSTPLWTMEHVESRMSPAEEEYNRKLSEQIATKVSAIHDILGVNK